MLILLLACGDKEVEDTSAGAMDSGDPVADTEDCSPDADGDGYCESDCDDADAAIHPDAVETCDGVDEDCDGSVDEGAGPTWYIDSDGDGYGGEAVVSCEAPDAYADNGADCDDTDETVYPGAEELSDGQDNDCDDKIDEGVTQDDEVSVGVTWGESGVTVSISGGSGGSYEFGMAETGAGVNGWYGETCIPGDEPGGYDDYGYDVCHRLGGSGGAVTSVYPSIDDVDENQTLFDEVHDVDLTYFLGEEGTSQCWVFGEDVDYYSDFGCEEL